MRRLSRGFREDLLAIVTAELAMAALARTKTSDRIREMVALLINDSTSRRERAGTARDS